MAGKHPGHQTQWAAQFAVASELCKRDYEVAFTMGNHPDIDLMVISPGGDKFVIDVKGQYKRNPWPVKEKRPRSDLYYVLAFVPKRAANRFFILSQSNMSLGLAEHIKHLRSGRIARGLSTEKVGIMPCLPWSFAEKFEDKWCELPG
jgi:hypothetical protein